MTPLSGRLLPSLLTNLLLHAEQDLYGNLLQLRPGLQVRKCIATLASSLRGDMLSLVLVGVTGWGWGLGLGLGIEIRHPPIHFFDYK